LVGWHWSSICIALQIAPGDNIALQYSTALDLAAVYCSASYALHQLRSECRQVDRKAMLTTPGALAPILGITVGML